MAADDIHEPDQIILRTRKERLAIITRPENRHLLNIQKG